MSREWLMPQLQEDNDNFTLVQDCAPPHWQLEVRNYLDEKIASALDWTFNRPEHGSYMLATKKSGFNSL
jgi:hypothetical protein